MRTIDALGRITIPKEIRVKYELNSNTDIKLVEDDDCIKLVPQNISYKISINDMQTLRELFMQLNSAGLLDENAVAALSRITKMSNSKCDKCNNNLFVEQNGLLSCIECNKE